MCKQSLRENTPLQDGLTFCCEPHLTRCHTTAANTLANLSVRLVPVCAVSLKTPPKLVRVCILGVGLW